MKKFVGIISILLLLVVGCGKKTMSPSEELAKSLKEFDNADNVTVNMTISMDAKMDGEDMHLSLDSTGKVDIKNLIYDMDMSFKMGSISFDDKVYAEKKDNNMIMYIQDILGSSYTKCTLEDFLPNIMDSDVSFEINNVKKVDSDIKELDKYEVIISKDEIKKALESNMNITEEYLEVLDLKGDLVVNIYLNKVGELAKMYFDMKSLFGTIDIDEDNSISNLILTFEFSDLNKTNVSIPEDVKQNAVEGNIFDDMSLEDDII